MIKHQRRTEDLQKGHRAFNDLLDRLKGSERDIAVLRRVVDGLVAANFSGMESRMILALPYNEYLQTNHWDDMRKRAMHKANYRCMTCNAEGELHTHHRTYENLGREDDADLICLCKECHELFHSRMRADHQFAK